MDGKIGFDQWAILELMGHVRLAGRVTEEEMFGAKIGRIEIPHGEDFITQYFGGGSIYRLTPTTEEIARRVASHNTPEPVHPWEMKALPAPVGIPGPFKGESDDPEDEYYDDDPAHDPNNFQEVT